MGRRGADATPRILGLTGPIGCGKTTVGDLLLQLGAIERIDADLAVHALMQPGTDTTREIARTFGDDVLAAGGGVHRARLAEIVFGDPPRLAALEAIVHPAVRTAIRDRIGELAGRSDVVVIDAVKLLQSDLLDMVETVWVVSCSPDVQLRRLTEIRSMTPAQAQGRLRAQPSFQHPRVSRVIENSGSLDDLRNQVSAAWQELNRA